MRYKLLSLLSTTTAMRTAMYRVSFFLFLVAALLLSSCSTISRNDYLIPADEENTPLIPLDTSPNKNIVSIKHSYKLPLRDSISLLLGSRFGDYLIWVGPPIVPFIPSPSFFDKTKVSSYTNNAICFDIAFLSPTPLEVDVHQIAIHRCSDSTPVLLNHFSCIESYYWTLEWVKNEEHVIQEPKDIFPSISDSTSLMSVLRVEMQASVNDIEDGIIITFKEGFISGYAYPIPPVTLRLGYNLKYTPFIFMTH